MSIPTGSGYFGAIGTPVGLASNLPYADVTPLTDVLRPQLQPRRLGAADPVTFAGVGVAPGTVAVLASYIPARRAARIDPMVALSEE